MQLQEMSNGLNALGFFDGYALAGDPAEIILWEHAEEPPSISAIKKASKREQAEREQADQAKETARESARSKLGKLGLTADEVASIIGGL